MSEGIVRSIARSVATRLASGIGAGWGCALSGVSLVVPYYHMVSDEFVPHVSTLYRFRTTAEFAADVEYLLRHFQPVGLQDIVDHLSGLRRLRRRCFHLTFDDGFREMYDVVAPILLRAGAPATFFLNTAFLDGGGIAHYNALGVLLGRIESRKPPISPKQLSALKPLLPPADAKGDSSLRRRVLSLRQAQRDVVRRLADLLDVDIAGYIQDRRPYLSSEQVTYLLRKGFTIGAHSHDHSRYTELSLDEQVQQTRTSIEFLERRFGIRPKSFAFPYSDAGIGRPFFSAVYSGPLLDVSFGTDGLVSHFHPRNIERISMEKTAESAAQIFSWQLARTAFIRLRLRR